MPTVTVLDDTFSDPTTVNINSRNATVGGAWTAIEVSAGNGIDGARVIGGTGNAHSSSGSPLSGNRSEAVLTSGDWDVYFDVVRPSGVFGSVRLFAGDNTSGVGGWSLVLSNFSDRAVLISDSTSFAARGTDRILVDHVVPVGTSTYQLRKRGAVLSMFRNGVQLGTDWTDPDPTAGSGCVAFAAAASDNLGISRVWATIEAPDITITGPSGAAGAASITHSVNENQNNAGTWSATGGTSWSLSGTDAALLSISSGGVVTLTSGNFYRETKASYSFNVLRDAVAQAVTLNINNVNEAPTFVGPSISVPGLVEGVAMSAINAAPLFADPDSGDTGTYSAVGSWPAGVTVSSAGVISGTPTTPGTYSDLRVRRTDVGALTADSNLFTITVSAAAAPVSFTGTVGAQSGTVDSAFAWSGASLASFFSGGLTPFSYSISAGSLPPGLTLNASTGVVSGTPTTAGSYAATFRATDTGANTATSNSVAFTIAAAPTPPPPPPPPGSVTLPAVATDATGSTRHLGQTTRMVVEPFTSIEALGTGTRTIVTGTTDPTTGEITLTGVEAGTYAVYRFFPSTGAVLSGVSFRIVTVT